MRQRFYHKITDIYGASVEHYAEHRAQKKKKNQTLWAENFYQWEFVCLMWKEHRDQVTEQGWLNRSVHTHGMEENHRAGCK